MIRRKTFLFVLLIAGASWVSGCSLHRNANDEAVERLRQQLVREEFDRVYEEASDTARAQVSRENFIERIKDATAKLKSIDPQITWRRDERGSPEESVYRDDNWSSFNLSKNGRTVNVQLNWGQRFALCGISISGDISKGGIGFRNCD